MTIEEQKHPMRIAIPHENGRLHGHFGGAREFALIEANPETRAVLRTKIQTAPEHKPGAFPRWLREQGVTVVIAGGIGHRALANFAHHGITVRAGQSGAPIEEMVAAYLQGRLTDTPDGCEHHGHHHGHDHDAHSHHHDHDHENEDGH